MKASYRGTPMFLSAEDFDDGMVRVCPVQDDLRSWHAMEALAENVSRDDFDMLIPKSARRRAAARRVEWLQDDPDDRVFTRTAAWDVSPAWWLAFDFDSDRISIREAEDGSLRVCIRARIMAATVRVEWAHDLASKKSELTAVVESVEQFVQWLNEFDPDSVLELDLGGMSEVLWPDTGKELIDDWVDALFDDDPESAAVAFEAYTRKWEQLSLYARSS